MRKRSNHVALPWLRSLLVLRLSSGLLGTRLVAPEIDRAFHRRVESRLLRLFMPQAAEFTRVLRWQQLRGVVCLQRI